MTILANVLNVIYLLHFYYNNEGYEFEFLYGCIRQLGVLIIIQINEYNKAIFRIKITITYDEIFKLLVT